MPCGLLAVIFVRDVVAPHDSGALNTALNGVMCH